MKNIKIINKILNSAMLSTLQNMIKNYELKLK